MNCTNCGTTVEATAAFCPNCGTHFGTLHAGPSTTPSTAYARPAAIPMGSVTAVSGVHPEPEEKVKRIVAYLIDIIPMLVLSLLHFLPIFGWMLYGLLHVCYWLLRDMNGASPGKLVMGSVVLSEDGRPATTNQRILRNVPLAVPGLLGMIPLLGIVLEVGFAVCIFSGEAILLLATGRRLGDRLARTMVFRR